MAIRREVLAYCDVCGAQATHIKGSRYDLCDACADHLLGALAHIKEQAHGEPADPVRAARALSQAFQEALAKEFPVADKRQRQRQRQRRRGNGKSVEASAADA